MSFIIDIAMAWLYLRFVMAHYAVFATTHSWQVGLIVVQETLLVVLFLARRRTEVVSRRIEDWVVAGIGTFAPLLLRPTGIDPIATAIQMTGVAVSIASLASLRRSFGLVAAHRGTVTGGMYGAVRHPQYAAHLMLLLGYLMSSPTCWNLAIVIVTVWGLGCRIAAEEKLLLDVSAEYREYAQRVKYRLIPGVL